MNPNGEKIVHIITQPPSKKKSNQLSEKATSLSSSEHATVPASAETKQHSFPKQPTHLQEDESLLLLEKSQRVAEGCTRIEHNLTSARDFIRQYHSNLTVTDRKLVEDQISLQQSLLSGLEVERTNLRLTIQSYLTGKRALLLLLKESFPNAEKIIPKLEEQVQHLDRAFGLLG